jgi:hypothetical protein
MMVALPSMLLVPLSMARVAGPRPAALAVSAVRTVELPPAVRVPAWAPALPILLPSVARATGPGPVALAPVLSAARTVELPLSVLGAAWAPALAVLLPTASEL